MGVEKDAHADTWGAGVVEQGHFRRTYTEGRRDVDGGRSDLQTIRQGGRRVGGPPESAPCRRERHGQRIGPLGQLWVSSLGSDDRMNDAPFIPLHTPTKGIRPDL